jgi:hypothetical protein
MARPNEPRRIEMSNITKIAAAALTAATLFAFAGSAEAYQCKAQGEAAIGKAFAGQNLALNRSKANWTQSVKGKFGLEWSVWNIAAAPSQNCSKNGNMHQCTVVAKPCK